MALLRSLDSGVSGMLNNQLTLDVSANNLANVNTPGFKGSRVSFSSALIQTRFNGSAPGTNIGGQNPRQVGLGVASSSVDVDMGQGALGATGRDLDLSIQGEGFFEVSDGTQAFYTRVGNFGIDSNNDLVHLSSGYRVNGNTYRSDLNPDGSQTILDQNIPINVPQGQAFPPSQTQEVTFQGNLSAATSALQGNSVQSVYPIKSTVSNGNATEDTPLSELDIFKGGAEPLDPNDRVKRMYVYGTKPNGETYASQFNIEPWTTPTAVDNTGSLGKLIEDINGALGQGSDRFGTARVENGSIIVTSVGSGDGFSFFMGEDGALPSTDTDSAVVGTHLDVSLDTALNSGGATANNAIIQAGANGKLINPSFAVTDAGGGFPTVADFTIAMIVNGTERGRVTVPSGTDAVTAANAFTVGSFPDLPTISTGDTITYQTTGLPANVDVTPTTSFIGSTGVLPFQSTPAIAATHTNISLDTALNTATTSNNATIQTAGAGLINPEFSITDTGGGFPTTTAFTIAILINGNERGSITLPSGTDAVSAAHPFGLTSYPHVKNGDVITYQVSNMPANVDIIPSTKIILDNDPANKTQDLSGGIADGIADMFEEDSAVDVNAWSYLNESNATFNWYRARLVPDSVTSSIEVFDSEGGKHNIEARFIRVGTRTELDSDARINSWDMIMNIDQTEGTIVDDLVVGIEFDQNGRFTGSVGSSIHKASLTSSTHVGNPTSATVQVNWATTGPTDPATVRMDFGDSNSVTGLSGFGSTSTASAVDQDGFADGKLDAINVSSEGDLIALYTNGISRKLAQIPLVTFANPGGLSSIEGNLWGITTNSGSATRRTPGQNAGFVTSGALESSNVDIATEFTRLITAQRGFQVSARVVQTTDEILEELANLVR